MIEKYYINKMGLGWITSTDGIIILCVIGVLFGGAIITKAVRSFYQAKKDIADIQKEYESKDKVQ